MVDHEYFMKLAIQEAQKSFEEGSLPFSVIVVDPNGKIVWKDHDRVKELVDPTAHAEINAIRNLCKSLYTLSLKGYSFYTTSEPCLTCLSSCIKAKVSNIYYGAETESDASLPIKAIDLAKLSTRYSIKVIGGILGKECLEQREKLTRKE